MTLPIGCLRCGAVDATAAAAVAGVEVPDVDDAAVLVVAAIALVVVLLALSSLPFPFDDAAAADAVGGGAFLQEMNQHSAL